MTAQIYRPDDDEMAEENSQAVRADDLLVPGEDPVVPGDDAVVPGDDMAVLESDRTGHDEPVSFAFAAVAPADLEPAASAVPGPPGSASDDHGADQPEMSDRDAGERLPTPVATVMASSAAESPHGDCARTAAGPWSEIQARFVDDPRASIELAAGLVDDRVAALAASVRNRQESLRSTWQGQDAGTEEMRLALQHYRAFWHRLEDYPAE